MIDSSGIERPIRTGQNAGPDLDDPGLGRQDDVVANEVARQDRRPAAASVAAAAPRRERSCQDRCSASMSVFRNYN